MSLFHGGRLADVVKLYGGEPHDWLDLSTGISPLPYPFDVSSLPMEAWTRLPERQAEINTEVAARRAYGVATGFEVVVVPGLQSVIGLLPSLFPGVRVAIVSPTYSEHAHCWKRAGRYVQKVPSVDAITNEFDGAVVVNPNNPDGRVYAPEDLRALAARLSFLVLDEAFSESVDRVSLVCQDIDNTIILRSFGKFFGLAGVRLGFVICNKDLALKLREGLGPWAVSGPALAIGKQALSDLKWQKEARRRHHELSDRLVQLLTANGFEIIGQTSLFVLAKSERAQAVFEHLCSKNILVRPFDYERHWLRFGLTDEKGLKRLEKALRP